MRNPVSQYTLEAPPRSAPPAAASDALAALRRATQERHARLDAGLRIARPEATLDDYADHAAALRTWLAALAPELQQLAAQEPRFAPDLERRLRALDDDLRDAGRATGQPANASAATQTEIRHALDQAPLTPDAVRWGMAYVLEGSQLGGQVMHRQLAGRLAPHPLRYFQGRGADTGAAWKAFLALLRAHLDSPQAIAAACLGANAAFAGLEFHLHVQGPRTP